MNLKSKLLKIKDQGKLTIKPECLNGKSIAFINKGFFTPCCQIDGTDKLDEFRKLGFLDDEFHISNLSSEDIEKVFESEVWQDFYTTVLLDPESAPNICKAICGYINDVRIKPDKIGITQL